MKASLDSSTADVVETALGLSTPWLLPDARAIVRCLVTSRGVFRSASRFSRSIGARNRHELAHILRKAGLPPLERLGGWIRIMFWVVEYEVNGTTICNSSLTQGSYPASRYRLVSRLTGHQWTKVRKLGLVWLLEQFLKACRPPAIAEADIPNYKPPPAVTAIGGRSGDTAPG